MSAENPSDAKAIPSPSPAATNPDQTQKWLNWAGYFCGGMAFLYLPILLGLAGVVIGIVNFKRGQRVHGQRQIWLGGAGFIIGTLISMAVRGAFRG